jgi:hypothetical protein
MISVSTNIFLIFKWKNNNENNILLRNLIEKACYEKE